MNSGLSAVASPQRSGAGRGQQIVAALQAEVEIALRLRESR
jgi:hypothetical protein